MSRPGVELRIERLVTHGVARDEAERIARVTETELVRLLAERGLAPEWRATAGESHSPPAVEVEFSRSPESLGSRIAAAVHGVLGS